VSKVLIVAGGDLFAELGGTILWSKNVRRIFADSPRAATDAARGFLPSLVVVEARGELSGAAFIRTLRTSPGTRRSSMVVLSRGHESEADLLAAGANLILVPPIDPELLNPKLETLLSVPRRVRVPFPVTIMSVPPVEATCLDISSSGILIEGSSPLPEGALLEIRFRLPGEAEDVLASVRVVRVSTPRIGLRFEAGSDDVAARVRSWVAAALPHGDFGRYEPLDVVGEGSMGRVWRAFDPLAQRVVAIKTLKPDFLIGAHAEDHLQRFRREAQAAARLDHPNIVTIHDVGEDYFAMEMIEGATLQALLHERGRLVPEEAFSILQPVAEALDHAHALGTVHRDIKPANIMVLPDGRPKIMDFGVAHLSSGAITADGLTMGSPAYMAPEQVVAGRADDLTDIYSFGVVAYEMLTGHRPFQGSGIASILYKVVNEPPPVASSWSNDLPAHFDAVLRRALAKEPSERFKSARALVAALADNMTVPIRTVTGRTAVVDLPRIGSDETQDLRTRPWRYRPAVRQLVVAAAAMALLVSGAAVWRLRQAGAAKAAPLPPPRLQITSEPAAARVFVDERERGKTPFSASDATPGSHLVRVERDGYATAQLSVNVPAEGLAPPLNFVLRPLVATITIDSDPSALVSVDGVAVGQTPITALAVPPGEHEVRLERMGFEAWRETIVLEPGQTPVRSIHLRRLVVEGPKNSLRRDGWVRRGDEVELGPGVTNPLKLSGERPAYPKAARLGGFKGTVTADLLISETGEVLHARIAESAGPVLDQALLDAVSNWHYQPATKNGVEVRVWIRVSHAFTLPE
jgi:serine/threonine-protein kinase